MLLAWALLTGVLGWKLANCCVTSELKVIFTCLKSRLKKNKTEENVTEDVTESLKY